MADWWQVFRGATSIPGRDYLPVTLSDQYREELEAALEWGRSDGNPMRSVAAVTAGAILLCGNGDACGGEAFLLQALAAFEGKQTDDEPTFEAVNKALFSTQRLDLIARIFEAKWGLEAGELAFEFAADRPGIRQVLWNVEEHGKSTFTFDSRNLVDTVWAMSVVADFSKVFPLVRAYMTYDQGARGSVIMNFEDQGITPGLAFSEYRPEYFLIPDYFFLSTAAYSETKIAYSSNNVLWNDRKPVAFWRGATSGQLDGDERNWRSLERIRLCEVTNDPGSSAAFDVGLSNIAQFSDQRVVEEIEASGFVKGFVSAHEWNKYKYQIDIDGNSSSWPGLFQRLLSGGTVLKVTSSRGWRQWYYDDLVPWENFVPVASDLSDLVEIVDWLVVHDDLAKKIGERGRDLANRLTCDSEIKRAMPTISAAICCGISYRANDDPWVQYVQDALLLFERAGLDYDAYLNAYPDLDIFGNDRYRIVEHFIQNGAREGRRLPVRDPAFLANRIKALPEPQGDLKKLEMTLSNITIAGRPPSRF